MFGKGDDAKGGRDMKSKWGEEETKPEMLGTAKSLKGNTVIWTDKISCYTQHNELHKYTNGSEEIYVTTEYELMVIWKEHI